MKNKILNSLLFILCFLVLYISCILIIGSNEKLCTYFPNVVFKKPGGYGNQLHRSFELDSIKNVDILFVGSSHSYRGFDPRIFEQNGINTFNLGNSQQTPVNSYFLLNEYVDRIKPKTVIIENYWRCLQVKDMGVESAIDLIINSPISFQKIKMAFLTKDMLVINTMIYSYFSRLFSPIHTHLKPAPNYVKGGYVKSNKKIKPEKLASIKPSKWTIKPHQIEYLNKSIELLQSKGIETVLVMAPVTKEFLYSIKNRQEVFQEVDSLVSIPNGVKQFNYNLPQKFESLNLNSLSDFYDNNHMNQTGVNKFNNQLLRDLKKEVPTFKDIPLVFNKVNADESNLIKNAHFASGLNNWIIKGDKSSFSLKDNKLVIKSSQELTGITQYVLEPNESYEAIIDIESIKKGGLQLFTGYSKITNLKQGINSVLFKSGEKTSIHIYRNGETEATISSIKVYKRDKNLVLESKFPQDIDQWELKGDPKFFEQVDGKGVSILSKENELTGITTYSLEPNKNYKVELEISEIKKGGLKVFTGYTDLKIKLEEGVNKFEFKSKDKTSLHIYRSSNTNNATIRSIKIWRNEKK